MEALRKKNKRTGNKITIDLPENFIADEIEIIISPCENIEYNNSLKNESDKWHKFSINNLEYAFGNDEPD